MDPSLEEWTRLDEFPDYSISTYGRFMNENTGRILAITRNQQGVMMVGLTRDGVQYRRSVALLVARAFLGVPLNVHFDTPIHVDGNRMNNHIDNIMWRPRWFAVKYNRQFGEVEPTNSAIEEIYTHEKFENSWDACLKYGLLHEDVMSSLINFSYCFPTNQEFRFAA